MSANVTAEGSHAMVPESGHDPPDNDRVRHHRLRELLGRGRLVQVDHMQEDVEDARQSAISFHATSCVA
jgi:hypothetical protein